MSGLVIQVSPPLIEGVGNTTTLTNFTTYRHTINAVGGFDEAEISFVDQRLDLEWWFANGLGRHIVVYNSAASAVWEGFVDSVEINLGQLTVTRGPLTQAVNRAALVYSTVNTSVTPPLVGGRAKTATVNHAESQARHGVLEAILSGGGMADTPAAQAVSTYLAENAWPRSSQTISSGSNRAPRVTLVCHGYYYWLDAYTYNDASSGTVTASQKILNAIAANPNSAWLPFDTANVGTNLLPVANYEDGDNTAWSIIKATVALGDSSSARWLFGVYENRRCYYQAIPTEVFYQQRIGEPRSRVLTLAGTPVEPWDVRPGYWLFLPDFMIGYTSGSELRADPRYLFIESVEFAAPHSLTIRAGTVDTLGQRLAQLGLAGSGG